ncbi:tail fiber protein [Escherichia coli]|nr:tail fiber protein [Escherichia coli]
MAKNDFKAFATDRNANVMSQRNGKRCLRFYPDLQQGKHPVRSDKAIRQASFIAAALAQL